MFLTPNLNVDSCKDSWLRKPDQAFIEKYDSIVPDISELVNYNIGLLEVEPEFVWISGSRYLSEMYWIEYCW